MKTLIEFQDAQVTTRILITTEGLWASALLDEWSWKASGFNVGSEACVDFLCKMIQLGLKADVVPQATVVPADERIRVQIRIGEGVVVLTEQQEH
jgi:hypothetical protein